MSETSSYATMAPKKIPCERKGQTCVCAQFVDGNDASVQQAAVVFSVYKYTCSKTINWIAKKKNLKGDTKLLPFRVNDRVGGPHTRATSFYFITRKDAICFGIVG